MGCGCSGGGGRGRIHGQGKGCPGAECCWRAASQGPWLTLEPGSRAGTAWLGAPACSPKIPNYFSPSVFSVCGVLSSSGRLRLQVRLALEVMFEGVCGTAAAGGVQPPAPGGSGGGAEKGQILRVRDQCTGRTLRRLLLFLSRAQRPRPRPSPRPFSSLPCSLFAAPAAARGPARLAARAARLACESGWLGCLPTASKVSAQHCPSAPASSLPLRSGQQQASASCLFRRPPSAGPAVRLSCGAAARSATWQAPKLVKPRCVNE